MADAELVDELEELLGSYLQSPGERELFRASELGRRLVRAGTRPEQLLAAHVGAMGRVLGRLPPATVVDGTLRSYQMLLEALMAYFLAYDPSPPTTTGTATDAATPPAADRERNAFGLEELYEQARDRAAQFRDLVEVGNALVVARTLQDACEHALQRATELTGAVEGAVWLTDTEGHLTAQAGDAPLNRGSLQQLARRTLETQRAVVDDIATPESREQAFGLPLTLAGGTAVGAITVRIAGSNVEQAGQSLDLLRLLASQLSAVIGTARLHQQLQQNVEGLRTLNRIGEALVQTLDPGAVAAVLLDGVLSFRGVQAAALYPNAEWVIETRWVAGDGAVLERRADQFGMREARATSLASAIFKRVYTDGYSAEVWFLPLRAGGRTLGTLEIHLSSENAFDGLRALLETLARHGATAIENARQYESALAHEAALQDLVSKLITAQEEERRRVAYDIHDGLAQTTAATLQQLQLLAGRYRPRSEPTRAYLEAALRAGQRAVKEAREVIAGLRPTILDDFGLAAALGREAETLRVEGREVVFDNEIGPARFAPQIETTLYRVAQESLTNVRRHAGPSPVRIGIELVDDTLRLEVRDWGRGLPVMTADPAISGHQIGIAGMRERLALIGGNFSITGAPGAGTTVTAAVPVPRT